MIPDVIDGCLERLNCGGRADKTFHVSRVRIQPEPYGPAETPPNADDIGE
jgi:hypothetical protein